MNNFTESELQKYHEAQKKGVSPLSREIWKTSGLDIQIYLAIYDTILEEEKIAKAINVRKGVKNGIK